MSQSLWEKFKFWLADTGKQLAIAILIVLVLRSSFVEPYKIPSGSMIPTLFIGDHIFVNKFAYGFKIPFSEYFLEDAIYVNGHEMPERGDVIVFRYPNDESVNYIKRVIALPGDVVTMRNKTLYINDKPVPETPHTDADMMEGVEEKIDKQVLRLYMADLRGTKHPVLHDEVGLNVNIDYGPRKIPPNSLFVMGDNRDRSADSRAWGLVPLRNVKGKAMFIWLNFFVSFQREFKFNFRPSRIATPIR